ncbi:hypothetical protein NDU88_005672 [Pleurodeles waltl]|uniref:Uncharacterized protein n=1 Tax=Pleurodeles waltl TaxID=8319 RepID=A0AAV7QII2_PLEWA|nr:hypothetical protein NDU88_005672 [Pleurodeles waltl]
MPSSRSAIALPYSGCWCSPRPPSAPGGLQDPTAGLTISRLDGLLKPRPQSRPPSWGQALNSCAPPTARSRHLTPAAVALLALPSAPGGSRTSLPGPRGPRAAGSRRIPNSGPGALL